MYFEGVIYTLLGGRRGSREYHQPLLWRLTDCASAARRDSRIKTNAKTDTSLALYAHPLRRGAPSRVCGCWALWAESLFLLMVLWDKHTAQDSPNLSIALYRC